MGETIMNQNYLAYYDELNRMMGSYGKENPEVMGAFMKLHQVGSKAGALKSHIKELIGLGISISTKCDGCITMHIHDALEKGATHAEIVETIGVAVYMGGGPSVIYGAKAFDVLQELEAKKAKQ